MDDRKVGMYSPDSAEFMTYETGAFYTAAGTHTIKFQGTIAGDNTAFIDAVSVK
ncbi:hypothetical protein [Paenibacillus sp. GCM10027626]|uniref:hypothetical protein n=1 Tax=Paenibacillus sp. GCM10027626 TaxID=3273411 RepID=UPI00364338C4